MPSSLKSWLAHFDLTKYIAENDSYEMLADGVLFFHFMKDLVGKEVGNLDELDSSFISSESPNERLQTWKIINNEIFNKIGIPQSEWYLTYLADGYTDYIKDLLNIVREAYPDPPKKEEPEDIYPSYSVYPSVRTVTQSNFSPRRVSSGVPEDDFSGPSYYMNSPKRTVTESEFNTRKVRALPDDDFSRPSYYLTPPERTVTVTDTKRSSNGRSSINERAFTTSWKSKYVGLGDLRTKSDGHSFRSDNYNSYQNNSTRPRWTRQAHNESSRRHWGDRMATVRSRDATRYFSYKGNRQENKFSYRNTNYIQKQRYWGRSSQYQHGRFRQRPPQHPAPYSRKPKGEVIEDEIERRFSQLIQKFRPRRFRIGARRRSRYVYRYYMQYR